jgi:MFS family permease
LLVVASFVSYALRFNVSSAGPTMMADLGITEQQLGYILAAFAAGYAIFQFPGGVFGVVVGPRRALAVCLLLWGVLTVVTALIPGSVGGSTTLTVALLILVRFLVGAVHAPMYPITGGVVERWFPIGHWALPNGLSSTGLTVGTAATAAILPFLLERFGWRVSFLMLAPLSIVALVLWWWYVRDLPAQHKSVNQAELDLIQRGREGLPGPESGSWRAVLRNRDVWLLLLAYASMNYIFALMFNWVFYYLVTVRGFESHEAGYATSVQWMPAAVAVLLSGIFLAVGALSSNVWIAVGCLAMSFFCNQLTEGPFWAAAISVGGRNAAAACGFMNTGGNGIGFVNALLVPFTASTLGWTAAMLTGTAFAVLSAVLWLFIRADRTIQTT